MAYNTMELKGCPNQVLAAVTIGLNFIIDRIEFNMISLGITRYIDQTDDKNNIYGSQALGLTGSFANTRKNFVLGAIKWINNEGALDKRWDMTAWKSNEWAWFLYALTNEIFNKFKQVAQIVSVNMTHKIWFNSENLDTMVQYFQNEIVNKLPEKTRIKLIYCMFIPDNAAKRDSSFIFDSSFGELLEMFSIHIDNRVNSPALTFTIRNTETSYLIDSDRKIFPNDRAYISNRIYNALIKREDVKPEQMDKFKSCLIDLIFEILDIIKGPEINYVGEHYFELERWMNFIEEKLVDIVDANNLIRKCAKCSLKENDNDELIRLLACSKCRLVTYCGKECQINDWKSSHKYKCFAHQ